MTAIDAISQIVERSFISDYMDMEILPLLAANDINFAHVRFPMQRQ
jgi:hypothetical protein